MMREGRAEGSLDSVKDFPRGKSSFVSKEKGANYFGSLVLYTQGPVVSEPQ